MEPQAPDLDETRSRRHGDEAELLLRLLGPQTSELLSFKHMRACYDQFRLLLMCCLQNVVHLDGLTNVRPKPSSGGQIPAKYMPTPPNPPCGQRLFHARFHNFLGVAIQRLHPKSLWPLCNRLGSQPGLRK